MYVKQNETRQLIMQIKERNKELKNTNQTLKQKFENKTVKFGEVNNLYTKNIENEFLIEKEKVK